MESVAEGPATTSAPHWATIDEEILCALCDYNLRGLAEPRCPECGARFTWRELLDPELRGHPYLFEHHPNRNLWSFWKTCRGTVRPRRFWTSLKPTQPSRPKRLIAYWVLSSSFILLLVCGMLAGPVLGLFNQRAALREQMIATFRRPAWALEVQKAVQRFGSVEAYANISYPPVSWREIRSVLMRASSSRSLLAPIAILVTWPWLTFLALMIFRWSMQKAKVKPTHVLRCVLYSFDGGLWMVPAVLLIAGASWVLGRSAPIYVPVVIGIIFIGAYRLLVAYRAYLRFDDVVATVLASQLITFLVVLNVVLFVKFW